MKNIPAPIKRSKLRTFLGKEYFILKRKLIWWVHDRHYARVTSDKNFPIKLIEHKSMLLRPLKNVDMMLQHNKITNLSIAISHLNNVVIEPGQTFSIWKLVGRPKASKGYLPGLVLHNGTTQKGIGGGLCQLGNLIYWMALHTPLTITERWRHSYDVFPDINRTIPFACGATLSYNYVDLQLKNETPYSFQLSFWLDETHLNGSITCNEDLQKRYEILETDHEFIHQWWGGYTRHNKIWKRIISANEPEQMELVSENHAIMMYSPLLENSPT
jgi:vancomycin resistance protein VanW